MKISLRFFARGFLDFSADANLPVQFDPVKPERAYGLTSSCFPFVLS